MDARKYHVGFTNLDYYVRNIPCQQACPVHTDARGYVTAIAQGDYERAYRIARAPNPFASVCGRVCNAPCEAACRRGQVEPGKPVSIRALKRFVNDRFGIYDVSERSGERAARSAFQYYRPGDRDYDLENSALQQSLVQLKAQARPKTGKRVAVVGAGPAGLSAAHDLALLGHSVTVFEAASTPGGMLVLGVPEYRLPRALVEMEIEAILSLGVGLEVDKALGRDFLVADLRREYDAVFIGIGTYRSRNLNVEGEGFDGVLRAIDFLINVNLGGYNVDLGRRVLVIGGGNVAMDVARTAARTGTTEGGSGAAESSGDIETALEVARAAMRIGATKEVHCLVVEARSEMLANPYEVIEAEEEGVVIHNHLAPRRITGENGKACGVETLDVARAFDDQKRFNPQLVPNTERVWEADSVIVAIGQTGDLDWIMPEDGLTVKRGGMLQVDENLQTTAPGIFAGGDVAFGPRLIIDAVANGQKAARGIDAYLRKDTLTVRRRATFVPIPLTEYHARGPAEGYLKMEYTRPPATPVDRRIGIAQVEEGYPESTARIQGARCLKCSINTIFDGTKCILCNGCVDVCPYDCLKLVRVSELEDNVSQAAPAGARSAMLFNPDHCVRCALCAQRCPTGAITMEDFRFVEALQA
ncbi:MAG: FAD-dependent oxidoreductase [Chloroflexi bacterium]|nr:FAD-dependent oxidoreductase [Chloroflexota bacterium]